ncbi:MAG: nickel ABC transporter permease [Bacillota bacterium]
MSKYILRRLAMMIPVILGVMFIVFTLLYITPGDPARYVLGDQATDAEIQAFRSQNGLDDPFFIQFFRFLWGFVRLDLGKSYITGEDVFGAILAKFPNTVKLTVTAMTVSLAIAIPAGIISATKQYSLFDNISMFFALLGISMPNFWLGLMLILLFSVKWRLLPFIGNATPLHYIMPSVVLGVGLAASTARMTRSSMLEVIRQDYIRTARAKGVAERVVILKHALKNALIPVITIIGMQVGGMLGGSVITETVFSWPGVGLLMLDHLRKKDYPMVLASVVFVAIVASLVNLLVDILYTYIDPRIATQYMSKKRTAKA